jgi:hypothetical protein
MFPYLSLRLPSGWFSKFLKIILWILLGCKLSIFQYFATAFLRLIFVCLFMMFLAFFFVFFLIFPRILIQLICWVEFSGDLEIFVYGW